MASLTEDTRVRKGPNKKYKYFVELAKGTRVFVETDKKKENDYTAVTTQDGIAGYVPSDRLQGQKETAWKFDKEPESFTQLKTKGQVCLGWHQVTNETSSGQLPSLIQSAKAMNVISRRGMRSAIIQASLVAGKFFLCCSGTRTGKTGVGTD